MGIKNNGARPNSAQKEANESKLTSALASTRLRGGSSFNNNTIGSILFKVAPLKKAAVLAAFAAFSLSREWSP